MRWVDCCSTPMEETYKSFGQALPRQPINFSCELSIMHAMSVCLLNIDIRHLAALMHTATVLYFASYIIK